MSCDQVLEEVRHCITKAQAHMKRIYDLKHQEQQFQVGDSVYLKLQPYCQFVYCCKEEFETYGLFLWSI